VRIFVVAPFRTTIVVGSAGGNSGGGREGGCHVEAQGGQDAVEELRGPDWGTDGHGLGWDCSLSSSGTCLCTHKHTHTHI
jgi:hypothetical protein